MGLMYLADHLPKSPQYRTRRASVSGVIVVHTAENVWDKNLDDGDQSAENVARFISRRSDPGSYHFLGDSDGVIELVEPFRYEAFHDGTGTNRHSTGISFAVRTEFWRDEPMTRQAAMLRPMADRVRDYMAEFKDRRGFEIPARRVSASDARDRIPGFISHAELDPGRRSDPGVHFPWDLFFEMIRHNTPPTQEDDDMPPRAIKAPGDDAQYEPYTMTPIATQDEKRLLIEAGLLRAGAAVELPAPLFERWKARVEASPSSGPVNEAAIGDALAKDLARRLTN